jgi:hypothetical protein
MQALPHQTLVLGSTQTFWLLCRQTLRQRSWRSSARRSAQLRLVRRACEPPLLLPWLVRVGQLMATLTMGLASQPRSRPSRPTCVQRCS